MGAAIRQPAGDRAGAAETVRGSRHTSIVLAVLALGSLAASLAWWWWARAFETTDNAFLTAHVTWVSPQVSGRVLEVLVDDNRAVAAGDVLLRLDPEPFRVRADQAQADLNEADRKLQQAKSQHLVSLAAVEQARAEAVSADAQAANAATDLKRYRRLVASGAVSQQAHDNAVTQASTTASSLLAARKRVAATEAQALLAATQIRTAQAVVDKCRAALEKTRLDLSYTEVRAQVNGRVAKKSVEPGDYLQAGQAILGLVREDLWVVANFKETQLADMRPGQRAVITVDAYPGLEFEGHVDSLQTGTGAAFSLLPQDNATGNYVKVVQRVPVKIVFDPPAAGDWHLAPGMSAVPRVRVR